LLMLLITQEARPAEDVPWGSGSPSPELFKLLQDLNRQYGADTVTLVSWLLDATTRSGSVLTASVRVNGNETREEATFLVFQVETGLIFNTRTLDQTGRLAVLWDKILSKAFVHLDTLRVPADGVMVDLLYHSKSFAETDDLSEHVDEPGPIEEAKFYFRADPLRAFLSKALSPQALLTRTSVLVNGTPVNFILPDGAIKTNASDGSGRSPSQRVGYPFKPRMSTATVDMTAITIAVPARTRMKIAKGSIASLPYCCVC
ncbi:MAG: hypothetical protein HYZ72_03965, partial [Deltaproteobacteria bacterium]|nr:hypothetical protein [Deltaproteobacteria bacterium]